ncbi:hypothetical protein NDU88_004933 [Pleurodeles waltl]|uniref:Uncharacterized protein n=1 Tax=Pleurodeles waltl TaxID=8319 RepID=A0AAV7WBV1_PLEWA|nr:hypothetical protein NDU88_004933 [Pleurodeles waltl]
MSRRAPDLSRRPEYHGGTDEAGAKLRVDLAAQIKARTRSSSAEFTDVKELCTDRVRRRALPGVNKGPICNEVHPTRPKGREESFWGARVVPVLGGMNTNPVRRPTKRDSYKVRAIVARLDIIARFSLT